MKSLLTFLVVALSFVSVSAGDLRSVPCQYLMPGEVIQSSSNTDGRVCFINMSPKDGDKSSYLIHIVSIWYPTNSIDRFNWVAMPFCALSQIALFENGQRTMYMVDTLSESSWMRRLYRRTCD